MDDKKKALLSDDGVGTGYGATAPAAADDDDTLLPGNRTSVIRVNFTHTHVQCRKYKVYK